MLSAAILSGFVMGFAGSMPPTGPVAVTVLERGLSKRHRDGFAVAVGAASAESIYAALALFAMTALFTRYPRLQLIAVRVGLVVLFGVGAYFVTFKAKGALTPTPGSVVVASMKQLGLGFMLVAANPVVLLTWSASVAALCSLLDLRFDTVDKLALVVAVPCGIVTWFTVLLTTLRRFEGRVTLRATQILIRTAGAILLVMALAGIPRALG